MAGVEVFDDPTVVQRQIVTVILFFADGPALEGSHLLGQLQDERLTIYDDAIEVEDNGAQQVGSSFLSIFDCPLAIEKSETNALEPPVLAGYLKLSRRLKAIENRQSTSAILRAQSSIPLAMVHLSWKRGQGWSVNSLPLPSPNGICCV